LGRHDVCKEEKYERCKIHHENLEMSRDVLREEEDMFKATIELIVKCIRVFRTELPNAIENNEWEVLKKYTNTSGKYKKTLILKTSANEQCCEYKIHLIPFFESHLCDTKRLFHNGRQLDETKIGGLLGWLGHQERLVDDQIELPWDTHRCPEALFNSFNIIKLAELLGKKF
jgi:hypothetical protein